MFRRQRVAALTISIISTIILAACASAVSQAPASVPAQPASVARVPVAQAAPTAAPATPTFPMTIKDDAGREVSIPAAPKRIVSLSSSNTEILYALGLEGHIAGVDDYSNYPAATKDKPKVGGFAKPDLEKIVALEPDLVLGTSIHVKATLPELDRRGLRTVIVDPRDVKGVLDRIGLVGKITGQQKEAETLTASMQTRIDSVASKLKGAAPVRVFYEISPDLYTAGPGSFVNDVLQVAGGANVAANAGKEWPQISQEALLLADPEVVLLADQPANVTPEAVAARPGWSGVSAVKNKRVTLISDDLTSRPGPRVADGIEMVAKILHPDKVR